MELEQLERELLDALKERLSEREADDTNHRIAWEEASYLVEATDDQHIVNIVGSELLTKQIKRGDMSKTVLDVCERVLQDRLVGVALNYLTEPHKELLPYIAADKL